MLGRSFAVVAMVAGPAAAQDAFEIQVYDQKTAPAGEIGLEVHANYHSIRDAPDEEHLTFEPHYGLADWAELGAYIQAAVIDDGSFAMAGAKVRCKLQRPGRLWDLVGLAINGEISAVPARFEEDVWGSEVRPIADLLAGRLYASINPILATDLRGPLAGHPQFEPAVKLTVEALPGLAFGVEGYGSFGPIDDLGSEHVETLLGVLDWTTAHVDLNLGAGPSWGGPDRVIVKAIVGVH